MGDSGDLARAGGKCRDNHRRPWVTTNAAIGLVDALVFVHKVWILCAAFPAGAPCDTFFAHNGDNSRIVCTRRVAAESLSLPHRGDLPSLRLQRGRCQSPCQRQFRAPDVPQFPSASNTMCIYCRINSSNDILANTVTFRPQWPELIRIN
jgi:hypothetical protein